MGFNSRFYRRSLAYNRGLMVLTYLNRAAREYDKYQHKNHKRDHGMEEPKNHEEKKLEDEKCHKKQERGINVCINNYYDKEVINYFNEIFKTTQE